MAYEEGAENLALLKRTVRGTLDFTGRSRRTEVLYYIVASALISVVFRAVVWPLPNVASLALRGLLQAALLAPMFALFTRRLHDQSRSGWWTLVQLGAVGLNYLPYFVRLANGDDALSSIDLWIGVPLALVYLVLSFWPGTKGPNRFGPDPR